ncbi:MAG: 4'-phosphopantetheinyl transferase superfamily protein [Desulfuromonas sp.]|nr:4'-phosphopantetheinyl transferase superfamily protein [Desulfuromonas sp.]
MPCVGSSVRVIVYSAFFSVEWSERHFADLLCRLPDSLHPQVLRFRRWQDRQCSLLGKLLLADALEEGGYDPELLNKIRYSNHGRPFIDGVDDFNIAHSHQGVVCAFGINTTVGVDIEQKRVVKPRNFSLCMSEHQIVDMEAQTDPDVALLTMWVEKESVVKAHGVGMSYDFRRLEADGPRYRIDHSDYYIHHLSVHKDYQCCVTTDAPAVEIDLKPPRLE